MALSLLFTAAGCLATLRPPARSNGPASSPTGVAIAVQRQSCAEAQHGTLEDWVTETVELRLENGSQEPLTVYPAKFRLLGADGRSLASVSREGPIVVAKGGTRVFELAFTGRGHVSGLDCARAFALVPGQAVTAHQSAVALDQVTFLPAL